MMTKNTQHIIPTWFESLNRGDINKLLPLFGNNCRIKNAAHPVIEGKNAPKQLLSDFFARTESREFRLIDCAENGDEVFASWEGIIVFKKGLSIAGLQSLIAPLPVRYRGVERFKFDQAGFIEELEIVHETTSVPRLAALQLAGQTIVCPSFETTQDNPIEIGDETGHVDYSPLVHRYFQAEEQGNIEAVVDLCSDSVIVRNAANSPQYGKQGAREYVESFFLRTTNRQFTIKTIARQGATYFAHFKGEIGFREGAAFGTVIAAAPFDVTLDGICRFKILDGYFVELDVYHETTTALLLAKATLDKAA
jgi:ketosteroid isomerase-like protein